MSRTAERIHHLPVFLSGAVRQSRGIGKGQKLGHSETLETGAVFRLTHAKPNQTLSLHANRMPPYAISNDTTAGTPGGLVYPDACLTFLSAHGDTVQALVLIEVNDTGDAAGVYLMPMGQMAANSDYVLTDIDQDAALQQLAQATCVSFLAGTRLTMSTGAQVAVEDLQPGDRVLTRDSGPRAIRWIGSGTLPAQGAFAPVLIREDALHNLRDLYLCPDHRLFIYQRSDELGAGRSEVLVRAGDLVNGSSVVQATGAAHRFYQVLFDQHQIVYAEGIAVESMLVTRHTRRALPDQIGQSTDHRDSSLDELEAEASLTNRADLAAALRRASLG